MTGGGGVRPPVNDTNETVSLLPCHCYKNEPGVDRHLGEVTTVVAVDTEGYTAFPAGHYYNTVDSWV